MSHLQNRHRNRNTYLFYLLKSSINQITTISTNTRKNTNNTRLYRIIFLNTTNKDDTQKDAKIITKLTAAYRQTIWDVRNLGSHKKTPISNNILENRFQNCTKNINMAFF